MSLLGRGPADPISGGNVSSGNVELFARIEFPLSFFHAGEVDIRHVIQSGAQEDTPGDPGPGLLPVCQDVPNLGTVEPRDLGGPEEHVHAVIAMGGVGIDLDSKSVTKRLPKTVQVGIVSVWIPRVKANHSPNPARYPVTDTWHPNQWKFRFDSNIPEDIRTFDMNPIVDGAQSGFFANGAQYAEGAVVLSGPNGEDLGRGFAESVSYANTRKTIHQLAGLPDSQEFIKATSKRTVPLALRLRNAAYVLTHRKDIDAILADSAGLRFFIGDKLREYERKHSSRKANGKRAK